MSWEPGEFLYRGVQPTMYRSKFWTMRQYAGFGTAEESNERYRYLLSQGTTGLSVAFDLPTQMGMDSDDERCLGEVGKVGVAIDHIGDMEVLLKDIPLDKISTSMTINSSASVLLAMYHAVAERNGVDGSQIRGTIQNDILKEYIARGTYIFPPRPSMRLITDIFACDHTPKWNTISISGYHIREAGSTAAQELAFTLADGISYVEAAIKCGLDDTLVAASAFSLTHIITSSRRSLNFVLHGVCGRESCARGLARKQTGLACFASTHKQVEHIDGSAGGQQCRARCFAGARRRHGGYSKPPYKWTR